MATTPDRPRQEDNVFPTDAGPKTDARPDLNQSLMDEMFRGSAPERGVSLERGPSMGLSAGMAASVDGLESRYSKNIRERAMAEAAEEARQEAAAEAMRQKVARGHAPVHFDMSNVDLLGERRRPS